MDSQPTVTAVIPVRNEEAHIRTVLEQCYAQQYPADKLEFIIADGMSDDGTRNEIESFLSEHRDGPTVRVVDNPEHFKPTGMNRALNASTADVIMIMDAHAEYKENYVAQCVRVLQETGAENVGGPTKAIANGYVARAVAAAYNSPFSVGGARFHDVNYEGYVDTVTFGCWRREYLLSMGGYDEEFVRNQDDELNLRTILSGGKIYQSPAIRSRYYTRNSLAKLFKQQFQYGYWKVRVIQKHKRPASWRHLVPVLFVAGLVLGLALSVVHPVFAWMYAASLVVYALASITFSFAAAMQRGYSLVVLLPVVFLTYHIAYGLGFSVGLIDFVLTRKLFSRMFGSSVLSINR